MKDQLAQDKLNPIVQNPIKLYFVENYDTDVKNKIVYEMKDFYRKPQSPPTYKIDTEKDEKIIKKVEDTRYYLDMFWKIEPQCKPYQLCEQKVEEVKQSSES